METGPAYVSWAVCFAAVQGYFGWQAALLLVIASFSVLMMCVNAETKEANHG